MINKLYKARKGTEHIVRVIGKYREMLKEETLENTLIEFKIDEILSFDKKMLYSILGHVFNWLSNK